MSGFDVRFANIDPRAIVGRLIRNPGYGGPSVGPFGWTWRPEICKSQASKPQFHAALRESVERDGLRNPVLVYAFGEHLYLTFGGSRVAAAIGAGMDSIPAIINDYSGLYSEAERVTEDNWQSFFTDVPRTFEFGERGADYHYHLERARRHEHDEAGLGWLGETKPRWLKKEFPWIEEKE